MSESVLEHHDSEELRGEKTMGVSEEQAEQEDQIVDMLATAAEGDGSDDAVKAAIRTAIELTIDLKEAYGVETVELLEPMIDALAADGSERQAVAFLAKQKFEQYQSDRPSDPSDYIFVEFTDETYAVNQSNVWESFEIDENTGWVTLRYKANTVTVPPQRIMEIQYEGQEDWVEDYFA